jgi:AP-4 complex subunit epsilon-1
MFIWLEAELCFIELFHVKFTCYHAISPTFYYFQLQIKLLKILAVLGSSDKQASGHMYTVLGDIFRKGDTTSNIGNAILYECICCISSIFPNPKMLEAAAETTSKFLKVWT